MSLELGGYTAHGQQFDRGFRENVQDSGGVQHISKALQNIARSMSDNRVRNDVETARLQVESGLADIDDKYAKDTDLATLGERRSQDVQELFEGVRGSIHHKAAEFLSSDFDKAIQRDSRRTKTFIDKRDGEMRLAKMPEGMDLRMNKAIQAADGEEYQTARMELEDYARTFQPFMNDVAFANKWNSTMDAVDYKRALKTVQGMAGRGEEYDPEKYMHLNPNQAASVEATYLGAVREKQRKIAERQVDRTNALLPMLEDSLASAMQTGVPMDGTNGMVAELSGLGERGAKMAAQYQAQLDRSARVWNSLDAVKNEPFSAQFAMVETLRPEPGSQGYVADMEMYQRAGQMVDQRAKAFQADPAGFVRDDAMRRARAAADPWVKDEDLEPFVLQASMDLQRELGAAQPKVLTTGQAKGLKDEYERANGDGKAEILSGLSSTYGEDLDGQALVEMGLGYEHTFMADLYMSDDILGRRVLEASGLKEADIPVLPDEAKDIRKEVEAAYFEGPGEHFQQQYNLTGNPQWLEMSKRLLEITRKHGLAIGDGTQAVKDMWGRFNYITTEDVQIMAPADVDADDLEARLLEYRRRLPEGYSAFKDGTWKAASNGTGYVLALPTGEVMGESEDDPIIVSMQELAEYTPSDTVRDMRRRREIRTRHGEDLTRSGVEWGLE